MPSRAADVVDELLAELAAASAPLRLELADRALAIVPVRADVPRRITPTLGSLLNRRELEELVGRVLEAHA